MTTPYHILQPLCRYLQLTLDQYVEQDYTIVYFHYGLNSSNKPNFSVLLQGYKELARKWVLKIIFPTDNHSAATKLLVVRQDPLWLWCAAEYLLDFKYLIIYKRLKHIMYTIVWVSPYFP